MPKSAMTISEEWSLVRNKMFSGLSVMMCHDKKEGVNKLGNNVLEIPVDNVVVMQVLHTGQYGSQNCDSISLGEMTTLADSLKEFSADCELERKIVRCPRLEPLVKFDLHIHAHVRLHVREKKRGRHNVRMVETLENLHLAPDALLIALDPLLRNRLQRDIASHALRQRVGRVGSVRRTEVALRSRGSRGSSG
jgi:hypothetical protein